MSNLSRLRTRIDNLKYVDESSALAELVEAAALSNADRERICAAAADLVRRIRNTAHPGLMEVFLAEYGLSTDEGIALMCLSEALLRVPDEGTIDALIEDKIVPGDWGRHLGHSSSPLVNASTWALMLTGRVLDDDRPGLAGALRAAVKRLGEPVVRAAAAHAMREMAHQFVLGETIKSAMARAASMEANGWSYSYDMLGEAARTSGDAERYFGAYSDAIAAIADACSSDDVRANPGISVKLSALCPRYEEAQRVRVLRDLAPRLMELARAAKAANMGFNVDAEEADRLALSLDVIECVAADGSLAGWDGFGVVVQAYGLRSSAVIDWLYAVAQRHGRRFMVRLVKGAYWDTEIKHAQVMGLGGFPVFTRKAATDVSFIANARKLLGMTDRFYPQFATHNAHTAAAVLDMASDRSAFEFQKLHGMGDRLHELIRSDAKTRCRTYAPVGAHRDLLAYLVRRLLENGANSSFVNRILDEDVPPEAVAKDPFDALDSPAPNLRCGTGIFLPLRANSRGWDLSHAPELGRIDKARGRFRDTAFSARPLLAGRSSSGSPEPRLNPADPKDIVGEVRNATVGDVGSALAAARVWETPVAERAAILNRAASLYEKHYGKLFALLAREAGKTLPDAVSELREAADFLRYYAARAQLLDRPPRGVFSCISPWNFPLAIFTGQIAGALACGNAVLAKPAEQTPLVAYAATEILHEAGVPRNVLQFLPGDGAAVGAALTSDKRIAGIIFTGSTETAKTIRLAMAEHLKPGAPLIAETGGLNAMIVDSTALPEQAVRDIIQSAFQSAGQRCSALRCLYVQREIARDFKEMLFGAMDELSLGDPWDMATDIGPVINGSAKAGIEAYIAGVSASGGVLHTLPAPAKGYFTAPAVLEVDGIRNLAREVFGPVLHIATFEAEEFDTVLSDIAASGYGLTFGLHTRIGDRVQRAVEQLPVGNIYVNRNQIGAIVGSQPFGGEGLSGTGPKAGGPHYLTRMSAAAHISVTDAGSAAISLETAQARIDSVVRPALRYDESDLPGPTGESNRLSLVARAPLLCLGPGAEASTRQAQRVELQGGSAVALDGLDLGALGSLGGYSGVIWWGDDKTARAILLELAVRPGPILPLIIGEIEVPDVLLERHVCIDTTASGGNAQLLAEASKA